MASNRTMDMALGKLGKKSAPAGKMDDESMEEAGEPMDDEESDGGEKKAAFLDMCKAIKAGKFDEAYEHWTDCQEL